MNDLPADGDPAANADGPSERHTESEALDAQTLAEGDQTLSDTDQTASDSDQTASDSDQAAADSDQAASDRDLAYGGDPEVHDASRDVRDRSADQRRHSADGRSETASARDAVAHARDLASSARDQDATRRDQELEAQDAAVAGNGHRVTGAQVVHRAAQNRERNTAARLAAVDVRRRAAADRHHAARDREQSAHDRELAAGDREQARTDHHELLHLLAIAEIDALTGTRTRAAGLLELDHEIERARRTSGPVVVAYVDVVGLKAVNDAHGHFAGDALLRKAVHGIRLQLRRYDSITRVGGDEFLCVMSGATIDDARQRFAAVQTALADDPDPCEIKVGFAALAVRDTATDLINRADNELPASRGR